MSMKRYVVIMLLLMVSMVACQRDMQTDISQMQVEQLYPYAISEELALVRLNEFLQAWDGDETRASQRVVKSISSINCDDVIPSTRSTDLNLDIDDLLYVVEFEDGKGSAVIGADTRVEPVYAVLDETVLSAADFERAVNSPNADDLSTQIAATILVSALTDAAAGTYDFRPDEDLETDFTIRFSRTTIQEQVLPLLTTKWGQDTPYNEGFPFVPGSDTGSRQPAGCATIAVAQVINNQMSPSQIYINGHAHDLNIISQFTFDSNITDSFDKACLATFIYDIAMELDVEYDNRDPNNPQTTSNIYKARSLLSSLGFNNARVNSFDSDRVVDMLNDNNPMYVRGSDVDDSGHAWVIDGWKEVRTDIIERVTRIGEGTTESIVETTIYSYVHCNFGWYGKCDGYYKFGIFDPVHIRRSDEVELSYGDILYQVDCTFVSDLKMLTYDN